MADKGRQGSNRTSREGCGEADRELDPNLEAIVDLGPRISLLHTYAASERVCPILSAATRGDLVVRR
jgi:hypothetical protein